MGIKIFNLKELIIKPSLLVLIFMLIASSGALATNFSGTVTRSDGINHPTAANYLMESYLVTTNPDTDDIIMTDGAAAGLYTESSGYWQLNAGGSNFAPDNQGSSGGTFYIRFYDLSGPQSGAAQYTYTGAGPSNQSLGTTTLASSTWPTRRTITAVPGNQQVLIYWTAVAGEDYRVFRQVATGKYKRIATAQQNSYVDTGADITNLTNGSTYGYTVVGNNAGTWGPHSNVVTATPNANAPNITGVSPASPQIAGTDITISGTNFGASGTVYFLDTNNNLVAAPVVGAWGAASVKVTIPGTAKTGTNPIILINDSNLFGSYPFTVSGVTPTITSVTPEAGPNAATPWTTYVNINGTNFGGDPGVGNRSTASNHIDFNATQVVDANVVFWSSTRIVVAVPAALAAASYNVTVTAATVASNTSPFTVVTGKIIDNYEDISMNDYYDSPSVSELPADVVDIPATTRVTTQYQEGQYARQVQYPGATGAQWGGYWGGAIKAPLINIDATSCNMLVFWAKGDGSNNTIQLDVKEYQDGTIAHDEPYSSLDNYSMSDNSAFKEYKIPFSRLWRNEYPGSAKDDNIFSKKIQGYTFIYKGTNASATYNYVDFANAVAWTGPVIDLIGPNFGPVSTTTVTIVGSGFGAAPGTIAFNGTAALPGDIVSWTATKIVVKVPTGATSGPVVVTVSSQASNGVPFSVGAITGPVISGLNPISGLSGIPVEINGSNFGADPGVGNRSTAANHIVFGTTKVTDANVTGWIDTKITVNVPTLSNGIYPVQVRATNKESNIVDFTVGADTTPPGNVTGLSVVNPATGGQLNLSWANPGDADLNGILIIRRQGGIPTGTPVAGTTYSVGNIIGDGTVVYAALGTSFNNTGLTNGQLYGYKVCSYDNVRNYASGVTGSGTPTSTNTAPNSPTALVQYKADGTTVIPYGAWTNDTSVVLKFAMSDADVSDTLTPQVEVVTSGSSFTGTPNYSGPAVANPGTGSVAVVTPPLVTNTSYNWRAMAQDNLLATSGWIDYNAGTQDFRIDRTAPTNPTTCTETGGAPNNSWQETVSDPAFTWSGALDTSGSGVHGYSVYWGTDPAGEPGIAEEQTAAVTSYDPPAATKDVVYYLRVRTFDSSGNIGTTFGTAGNRSAAATLFTFKYGKGFSPHRYEKDGGIMVTYPNPFNPLDKTLPYEGLQMLFGAEVVGEAIDIYIFDANGRVIWQKKDTQSALNRVATWEGDTSYGEVAENGLYMIRVVRGRDVVARAKVLIIKK